MKASPVSIRQQVQLCIGRRVRRLARWCMSEQDGPITDVQMLLARAAYLALEMDQALAILAEVHIAIANWRKLALSPEVGLRPAELEDFAPAFEHEQMEAAASLLKR